MLSCTGNLVVSCCIVYAHQQQYITNVDNNRKRQWKATDKSEREIEGGENTETSTDVQITTVGVHVRPRISGRNELLEKVRLET